MGADFFTREPRAAFPPTRRSAIMGVASDDPVERARSFDIVVRAYWRPVYSHVRMTWRRSAEDASDLTQAFFARAFEKRHFSKYDPGKALFRTYLKTALDRFLLDASRDQKRQKRGGEAVRLSLDFDVAEADLQRLGASDPDDLASFFDAEWTRSLLASAVDALASSCREKGKDAYFKVFHRYVLEPDADGRAVSYASIAEELGVSVSDVTNYLSWSRREFRRLALEKVREITASEEEFRSEARAVLGIDP